VLDCFWEGSVEYEFTPKLAICPVHPSLGYIPNYKAFHGSLYSDYVYSVTGNSLYSKKIDNKTILDMAKKLSEHLEKKNCNSELGLEVQKDLARMFTVYGLLGAHLIGWW
jgi:hypothetical protein